jgi:hypothetical protein
VVTAAAIALIASERPNRDSRIVLLISIVTFPLLTLPVLIESRAIYKRRMDGSADSASAELSRWCALSFLGAALPGACLMFFWRLVHLGPRELPLFVAFSLTVIICCLIAWRLHRMRLNQCTQAPAAATAAEHLPMRWPHLRKLRRAFIAAAVAEFLFLSIPYSPAFFIRSASGQVSVLVAASALAVAGVLLTWNARVHGKNYIPCLLATALSVYAATVLASWYAAQ